MSATTITTRSTSTSTVDARVGAGRRPVWRAGLAAAAAASVTTTALAALAAAAGVGFSDGTGASIPLAGFAQLTFVFSMIGVALAAVLARRAGRPRATFVRITVALTVLSFVPDLLAGFDRVSALSLMLLHAVAALIVVPVLARRLTQR